MTAGDWGPGKTAIDDRVRRAGRLFVLAHSLMPALAVVELVVSSVVQRTGDSTTYALVIPFYVIVVVLLVRWARKQQLRPGRWRDAASISGGVAGFLVGGPLTFVADALGLMDIRQPFRWFGFLIAALCLGVFLGVGVSRLIVKQAKRILLEPLDDALIHSDVEIPFVARDDRRTTLSIAPDQFTVRGGSNWSKTTFSVGHSLMLVTDAEEITAEDGGPAVRMVVAGEELVFRTEEPAKLLRVIRERSKVVAP